MGYVLDAILKAANELDLTCRIIGNAESRQLLSGLEGRLGFEWNYSTEKPGVDKFCVSTNRPDLVIPRLLPESPHILIAIDDGTYSAVEFETPMHLGNVTSECFGFEFVVTTRNFEYSLAADEHDLLHALGLAAKWLRQANKSLKAEGLVR